MPSSPCGPPRKPRQSGYALWVGNLPSTATLIELKDHFARGLTQDIESLLLISKSSCAFVNYRTQAACERAVTRFHRCLLHGHALVCRVRKNHNSSVIEETAPVPAFPLSGCSIIGSAVIDADEEFLSPMMVGDIKSARVESATDALDVAKHGDKFIIIKSLSVEDLKASVRDGMWATQAHNEPILRKAYSEAENVYLVFSANKSGEYFGYARMASTVPVTPTSRTRPKPSETSLPRSVVTAATKTAPKGRIWKDLARGTLFWEADLADLADGEEIPAQEDLQQYIEHGTEGYKSFAVQWLSTTKVPFHHTRGLRNPWNSNREVKIARDGTELEPNIGRRLLQLFEGIKSPAWSVPSTSS